MYEQFYGLKENPFSLTPDPDFLFVSSDYQSALDQVLYGIKRREGFAVIVGDVGTGKTTLCWALLGRLERDLKTALILNPMLTAEDMLKAILQDFGVKASGTRGSVPSEPGDPGWMQGLTRKELIDELNLFLIEQAQQDVFCVLIIDEAQDLSMEVLKQLRLLSNLETTKKKLLQIIFVGQIEFDEKLKAHELRSLNQRISIRYELKPLSEDDTASYVEHRLRIAESPAKLEFTVGAMREVYRYSRGYPRLANLVCDRALLAGQSQHTWTITSQIVRKAAGGLGGRHVRKSPAWRRLPALRMPAELRWPQALNFKRIRALKLGSLGRGLNWSGSRARARAGVTLLIALAVLAAVFAWRGFAPAPDAPDSVSVPPQSAQASTSTTVAPLPTSAPLISLPRASDVSRQPERGNPGLAGQYHVQVHTFRLEEQADSAARQLQGMGFAVQVRTEPRRAGGSWFVVLVGPFGDEQSARECMTDLRRARHSSPLLVRSGS